MSLKIDQTIQISEDLKLELLHPRHVDEIFEIATRDREHLNQWLTWVGRMQGKEFISNFVRGARERFEAGQECGFVIIYKEKVVGRIGISKIDLQNLSGEIGYWLDSTMQGKGFVFKACRKLTEIVFDQLKLNRIEIRCAVGNIRSQQIPAKLGYQLEGIIREGELLHGSFTDLKLYSMLKADWESIN